MGMVWVLTWLCGKKWRKKYNSYFIILTAFKDFLQSNDDGDDDAKLKQQYPSWRKPSVSTAERWTLLKPTKISTVYWWWWWRTLLVVRKKPFLCIFIYERALIIAKWDVCSNKCIVNRTFSSQYFFAQAKFIRLFITHNFSHYSIHYSRLVW